MLGAAFAAYGGAHIGSPDVYLDGKAGPYQLFVTIRPPQVIPGVAELEVRCQTRGVTGIRAVPLPLSKYSAGFSPVPDPLKVSLHDKQFFTGSLWLMADGSSQVRLLVDGDKGGGTLSIPVPSIALTTRKMQWQLGAVLCVLGLFLVGGMVAIVGASVREAKLPLGAAPNPAMQRNGRIAMGVAFVIVAAILWGGKTWWDSEANTFTARVYKPLNMSASVNLSAPAVLTLDLTEPGWMKPDRARLLNRVLFVRKLDDLVLDHDHLMHLWAIREPGLDVIYHLHPDLVSPAKFRLPLPAMLPGHYKIYADVVHENGLPETLTAAINLPQGVAASASRALAGDDAEAIAQPAESATPANSFLLPDGYRMEWLRAGAQPIPAKQGMAFQFRLVKPDGSAPSDMALYMGMLGHAAFVKTDGAVFAHIHPNGTVPMSALMLAQGTAMDHASMHMEQALPNEVSFPYGFPSAGHYRIFVQMKHGQTVETGIFDAIAN